MGKKPSCLWSNRIHHPQIFTIATYGWMVYDIALRTLNRCFTCCRHVGLSSPHFLVNLPVFAARHRSANWKRRRSGGFSQRGNGWWVPLEREPFFSLDPWSSWYFFCFLNFFSFSLDKPNGWWTSNDGYVVFVILMSWHNLWIWTTKLGMLASHYWDTVSGECSFWAFSGEQSFAASYHFARVF